jgi:hypothetical protein
MGGARIANMGSIHVTPEIRRLEISAEPPGDYYYARRYFVQKTRFWGYLRKPGQQWQDAQLVVMNEDITLQPDRRPESGPESSRHGFDQNFTYKVSGTYTGREIYEPASNLMLPEFKATSYRLVERDSGWLFSPSDYYNKTKITLVNASIAQ